MSVRRKNTVVMSAETDDWVTSIERLPDKDFSRVINSLSMNAIQKYPPRKSEGIPLGREIRVFRKYLHNDNNLFDPSVLWPVYRYLASDRANLLYRAFLEGFSLSRREWGTILGEENVSKWFSSGILREDADGRLFCDFCIIPAEGLVLVSDLPRKLFHDGVYLCQAPTIMRFLSNQDLPKGHRYLDVGTGGGAILLKLRSRYDEAIGIDINPRAIRVAAINAALNPGPKCKVYAEDVFKLGSKYGSFDMITWNMPYIFLPEDRKEDSMHAYGGDMGIELMLRFINILPGLLTDKGEAYLLSAAPILKNGINVTEDKLGGLVKNLGLDISMHVLGSYVMPKLFKFHDACGIRRFEKVILQIKLGRGGIKRVDIPVSFTERLLSGIPGMLYRMHAGIFRT